MATNWKALLLASMIATTAFGARNVIAAPAVSAEQTTFKDIDAMSNDTQAAIREAVSLGLIAGYPDGAFKPNEPLTRTQLAVLLVKALHLPVSANAGSSYKDVAAGSWSAGYIEAVRKAGLMNGTDAGFDPNRNVTRQELASVFVRAVNGLNTTGGRDADPALADGASGWAAASVQAALRLGLMTAKENGFAPREEVARADIAQLLVDIFPEKEQTATVTKIDGDVIMVDGTPLLVSDELKQLLLAEGNGEALLGAKLRYKSAVRSVNVLSELEIAASGTAKAPVKLDTTGMPADGTLKISGDQPVALSGKGLFREIQITNPKAKLTVGTDLRIARLVLPDGVSLTDIVTNLSQVQSQIGSMVSASGATLSLPASPVYYSAPTVLDKSALDAAIADASGLADAAVAGSQGGQYPQSAIDALKVAAKAASDVYGDAEVKQAEIDDAASALQDAIDTFKAAQVPTLEGSLIENRPFYLNSGKTGTDGDVVVGTGSVETYSKRNIKSYLQIKRGAELETLEYDGSDSANYKFNVLEGSSVVGAVYVESTSELVELASGPTGITVHPLEEATESTEASLVFHVKEGDKEVGKWTLPIIMDETAPTLSGSVYENGKFTITASEPLSPFGYSTSMMFSQSGDDSDYTVVDNTNAIYSVAIVGNQAIISLNEEAIRGRYTLQPNSKFKVNVAISDYADNSSNLNSTLSMPQA